MHKPLTAATAVAALAVPALMTALPSSTAAPAEPTQPGRLLGSYASGHFDEGGAEIVAYDPKRHRAFSINAAAGTVDVLSIKDPSNPRKIGELATPGANSVAVRGNVLAVAEQAANKTDRGTVSFFHPGSLRQTGSVKVGSLPDMVVINPKGTLALTANEGEPEGYCEGQVDPKGSVSIIDLSKGPAKARVRTVGFTQFDGREDALRQRGIRIFGPNASASQDFEPEYITVKGNSAWVTLQENNALARINLAKAKVSWVRPLGLKDHSQPGQGLDPNDKDKTASIVNRPVRGMYMPDGIASWTVKKATYLITANEGDAREWDCFVEESRVKDLTLDPSVFPADTVKDAELGRLNVTTTSPQGPNGYTELWAFGARSVSVRDAAGKLVWDSGDLLERVTADLASYNANHAETDSRDSRSDNKGPEPEGVTVGHIGKRAYAFVGLERTSAIAILDVTKPTAPTYVGLLQHRDDSFPATEPAAGDLGPEGVRFVPAGVSPNGQPLLLVGNEVSGTTSVWELDLP